MLAIKSWIIWLVYMAPCILANCSIKIPDHKFIQEMISTQGYFCSISVNILNKENVTDFCDFWALVYEVEGLLEKLTFIPGTENHKNKNHVIDTYKHCLLEEEYEVTVAVNDYLQAVNLNPIEILQRVNDSLHKLDGFKAASGSSSECESYYKKSGQNKNIDANGPRCACPSPTTSISSTATSQTSLSYLSVSGTYTTSYSIHTSHLTEDTSDSYPQKLISPPKNLQGLEPSPVIFTEMPSDLKPLTTIVDHSHTGTTLQSGARTDFPITNPDFPMHSTEVTKGIQNLQELDSSVILTDMPSDVKPLTTIVDHSHTGTTLQSGARTDFPITNPDFPMLSTEVTKGIQNLQELDSSPVILTDMPSDVKPLTTIVDRSHTGTTVQSGAYTDFPPTNPDFPIHSTEFTKGTHEPSSVSLNPSQTRTHLEQVSKDASNSHTKDMHKSVVPPTIENPSLPTYSLINGESSTIMELNEMQKNTMSEFGSQSSKGSVFQNSLSVPSKEPGIEPSSNSVTKVRRSVLKMDAISRAAPTQAVPSQSTSANGPNLLFVNAIHTNIPSSGMDLSNSEPLAVSEGKVIGDGDLGWASSYLSSTVLTTKTEPSVSSLMPGGQLLLSDVIHNPALNAHKSFNSVTQQDRDIAIDGRENSFSDPNCGSNVLPIIATEQKDERKEHIQSKLHLIIIAILVVLVLLFLCGFLYYRHQYRELKRRSNIGCDDLDLATNPLAGLPEERVRLPIIECEIV